MKIRMARGILSHRVRYRNPTLSSDPTAIWDYGYSDIDAITIGRDVRVGAHAEVIVYKHTKHSHIEGRLTLGDRAVISTGANVRAAGGEIYIGRNSAVGQYSVVLASTHMIDPATTYLHSPWDESKSGVRIGENVWMGALCVIMPGVEIGDNAVIGAGSIVTRSVPANELWAGVPARLIRVLDARPRAGG